MCLSGQVIFYLNYDRDGTCIFHVLEHTCTLSKLFSHLSDIILKKNIFFLIANLSQKWKHFERLCCYGIFKLYAEFWNRNWSAVIKAS